MPADDYVSTGTGGALKLKGAKVQKAKKKKSKSKDNKDKSASIERALSGTPAADAPQLEKGHIEDAKKAVGTTGPDSDPEPEYKTEAERRHEEAMKKKVSCYGTNACRTSIPSIHTFIHSF